ncbi:hypothetical protein AB1L88_17835 [Tautonia sp. JC769]
MLLAIDRGDFARAFEAQGQLNRLGWTVSQSKPSGKNRTPRNKADGRGVR